MFSRKYIETRIPGNFSSVKVGKTETRISDFSRILDVFPGLLQEISESQSQDFPERGNPAFKFEFWTVQIESLHAHSL